MKAAWSHIILHSPVKGRGFIIRASAIFTVLMVLLYLYKPAFVRFVENKYYDTLVRSAQGDRQSTARRPVIVDVDEKSLAGFGQWPWPRYRVALLLDKLREMGAAAVGLDMVLAEPDRTSFTVLKRDIFRDMGIDVPMSRIPKTLLDHDRTLAETLGRGPFVLGYKFIFEGPGSTRRDCTLHPLNMAVIRPTDMNKEGNFLFLAKDVVCSLPVLTNHAPSSGFLDIVPDFDGVLRRIPLIVEYNGKFYPSLALATFARALKVRQVSLTLRSGGVEALRLDNTVIPLDGKGSLLVRYEGKGRTFDHISAADALEGRVSKESIEGRIVFVGASATGIGDFHPTPVDTVFPGVEVHATVADNILQKNFLSKPGWVSGLELILTVGAGIFSIVLLTWMGVLWSLLFLCIGAFGLWQSSLWALHGHGIFFSPIVPLIALAGNFSSVTLLKYWRETRKVRARTRELAFTQDFTIRCLASLTETRDSETGGHILRTQQYVLTISRQLARHPLFADFLTKEIMEDLYKSAPLHDIGKVGVSDQILHKPGKLTPEEFEEMKKHTTYGRDAIQRAEERFGDGASGSFLRLAKEIAYTHHEKWDGTGYPENLKGPEIPVSGRIMALADVYDALICQRVYKPPFTHEEAVTLITQLREVLFDPHVVDAFLEVKDEFRRISLEFEDGAFIDGIQEVKEV